MEITPAFFISLALLLISIGGLVWALSARLGKIATERDLYDLERKLTAKIEEQRHYSVQTHNDFASKEELAALERELRGDLKEFRAEMRDNLKQLANQHAELLTAVTNLAHQVTARRTPNG